MDTEQILTYIGMCVVVLFAIYYVLKMGSMQASVIEGLTSKKDSESLGSGNREDIKALKSVIDKMSDSLLLDKYRDDYEDMLMDLEKLIDYTILEGIIGVSSDVKNSGQLKIDDNTKGFGKALPVLNELYTLKTNLNSTMEFLDNNK